MNAPEEAQGGVVPNRSGTQRGQLRESHRCHGTPISTPGISGMAEILPVFTRFGTLLVGVVKDSKAWLSTGLE